MSNPSLHRKSNIPLDFPDHSRIVCCIFVCPLPMTLCEHLSLVRTRIMNDAQCASVLGQCPVCLYAFTYEIDAELERPLFYRLVISKSLESKLRSFETSPCIYTIASYSCIFVQKDSILHSKWVF